MPLLLVLVFSSVIASADECLRLSLCRFPRDDGSAFAIAAGDVMITGEHTKGDDGGSLVGITVAGANKDNEGDSAATVAEADDVDVAAVDDAAVIVVVVPFSVKLVIRSAGFFEPRPR